MNNFLHFNLNFITNFKINLFFKNHNFRSIKYKSRIFCKNFFVFILLLKNKKIFTKNSIIVKKLKNNNYTFLRSPYRHKLARHQIKLNRYKISFFLELDLINVLKINYFFDKLLIFSFFKNFNNFFETNIIYMENVKMRYKFLFCKNFCVINFIK